MFVGLVCFGVFLIVVLLVDEIIRRKLPPQYEIESDQRERCSHDLAAFCEHYFPEVFSEPWTFEQAKLIAGIQFTILFGNKFEMRMERGRGTTSILQAAAIWAAVCHHRKHVVLLYHDYDTACAMYDSTVESVHANSQLAKDFDLASMSSISFKSITQSLTGITATDDDGHLVRPDLILVDDILQGGDLPASIIATRRRDFQRFYGQTHYIQPEGITLGVCVLTSKPRRVQSGCEATMRNLKAAREAVERMRSQNEST